jgi:hypothetical protein
MNLCMVKHCSYVAESALDDFLVCGLHDDPRVRAILEALRMPAMLYPAEPFLVFPGFALEEDDLVPRQAPAGARHAEDCPKLAEAAKARPSSISAEYDLLKGA